MRVHSYITLTLLQCVVWIQKHYSQSLFVVSCMHLLSGFAVKTRHDQEHPNVRMIDMVVSISMQQMTPQ